MVGDLMNTDRHSGLTLAPEAARDDMRRQIGKPITNEDLYAGCRRAFENGFSRVKLYFMCGLPGEREADLEGIIEMSETIARLGQEVRGRPVDGGGERVELRAEAADAVPVERHAAPRVFPRRPRVPASAKAAAERAIEVPRRRDEPVGGRDVSRRPAGGRGDRVGVAARRPVRRLGRAVSAASYGGKRWPTPASTWKKRFTSPALPPPPCPGITSAFGKGAEYLEREHCAGGGVWWEARVKSAIIPVDSRMVRGRY